MSSSTMNRSLPRLYPTQDSMSFDRNQTLCRQLFLMWLFVSQEGVLDEARDFIFDHINDPFPFDVDF